MTNSSLSTEAVDLLACEVLADLYRAYCGAPALGVRAYRDADALLLLLRFEPGSIEPDEEGDLDPLISAALRSMPGLIASAVEARAGVRLAPGNLSACSARGLAVFAFSVLEDDAEQPIDDDIFGFDASFAPQRASRPPLRLVS